MGIYISENNNANTNGIGFVGLLTLVFVVAKLAGWISWSWWWVFSPLWIGFGIFIILLVIYIFLISRG